MNFEQQWVSEGRWADEASPEGPVTFWQHLAELRPSKEATFWACVAAAVATIGIGFGFGGWVTGGAATKMVKAAADTARTELVATACVKKFASSQSFATDLASLKKVSFREQGEILAKGGWATFAGMDAPLPDAARLCASRLIEMKGPMAAADRTDVLFVGTPTS